jgi:hypothetical protein
VASHGRDARLSAPGGCPASHCASSRPDTRGPLHSHCSPRSQPHPVDSPERCSHGRTTALATGALRLRMVRPGASTRGCGSCPTVRRDATRHALWASATCPAAHPEKEAEGRQRGFYGRLLSARNALLASLYETEWSGNQKPVLVGSARTQKEVRLGALSVGLGIAHRLGDTAVEASSVKASADRFVGVWSRPAADG